MRKAISMILLAAASGSAMADWVAIDESSLGKTYVNPGTISRSRDLVRVWELIDFKKAQEQKLNEGRRPYRIQHNQIGVQR